MTEWRTVKIPAKLAEQVDALLEEWGYASRSAWVSETIRRRLESLPPAPKGKPLTSEEEDKLYSWAMTTNLKGAEEQDIRKMLLENQHLKDWEGIIRKLTDAVAFVLEMKKN